MRLLFLLTGTFFFLLQSMGQLHNISVGAENMNEYLPLLKSKRVAIVGNHTSLVNNVHLLDTLLSRKVKVVQIFCPEHGFRGTADAGQVVANSKDKKTGIKIISLYGQNKKPKPVDLQKVDVVLFDIQDVGVRFYTYISTLHYVMEACAERKKTLIILDRPNPNGFYVDGPVLELKHKSFVGLHPVPLVHGMTIGEYAQMINGEKWLANGVQCSLKIISCENYNHNTRFKISLAPSPNLRNPRAVYLYPSLGLFEGTVINVGRGTDFPFEVFGHPKLKNAGYEYTPTSKPGARNPPHKGQICYGIDLRQYPDSTEWNHQFSLRWLIFAYNNVPDKKNFFNAFFTNLAGTPTLRILIESGMKEEDIRKTWTAKLDEFKLIRRKYLLYDDF